MRIRSHPRAVALDGLRQAPPAVVEGDEEEAAERTVPVLALRECGRRRWGRAAEVLEQPLLRIGREVFASEHDSPIVGAEEEDFRSQRGIFPPIVDPVSVVFLDDIHLEQSEERHPVDRFGRPDRNH